MKNTIIKLVGAVIAPILVLAIGIGIAVEGWYHNLIVSIGLLGGFGLISYSTWSLLDMHLTDKEKDE